MNCCNAFGQCHQGHGCPARSTAPGELEYIPATKQPTEHWTSLVPYWAALILTLAASVATVCGIAGYAYARFFA